MIILGYKTKFAIVFAFVYTAIVFGSFLVALLGFGRIDGPPVPDFNQHLSDIGWTVASIMVPWSPEIAGSFWIMAFIYGWILGYILISLIRKFKKQP